MTRPDNLRSVFPGGFFRFLFKKRRRFSMEKYMLNGVFSTIYGNADGKAKKFVQWKE